MQFGGIHSYIVCSQQRLQSVLINKGHKIYVTTHMLQTLPLQEKGVACETSPFHFFLQTAMAEPYNTSLQNLINAHQLKKPARKAQALAVHNSNSTTHM